MSATGFTDAEREKMVFIMDLNGYEQDGEGLAFVDLHSGERKEFADWRGLFEFIEANFTRRNTAGNGGRKKE